MSVVAAQISTNAFAVPPNTKVPVTEPPSLATLLVLVAFLCLAMTVGYVVNKFGPRLRVIVRSRLHWRRAILLPVWQGPSVPILDWQRPRRPTPSDLLPDHLIAGALRQLPEPLRERYAEERADHSTHVRGWRRLWWAFWLRAMASRTGREYRQGRLPRNGG